MSFEVLAENQEELTILASRFIALLLPLPRPEDLKSLLSAVEERFPKANHYCYAAVANGFEGCSDDGEPSHTAGLPLLQLLQRRQIDYTLLVVVRYFGGTKLGLPRLKRTYSEIAERCLNKATFAEIIPGFAMEMEMTYHDFESLKKQWDQSDCEYKVLTYGEKVRLLWRGDAKLATSLESLLPKEEVLSKQEIVYPRRIAHD
jgi:putative IMPACT (imprinted ancient) family translation regulator